MILFMAILIKRKLQTYDLLRIRTKRKYKASNFDYATFSGSFTERFAKSLIKRSPYICIDLDHIGNSDAIMAIKTLILDNLCPALMFISPSGDGMKIIFKVITETAKHLIYFRALQNYFEIVIGHTADPSGSDVSRACFLPHDPDAYYNNECDTLDYAFINTFYPQIAQLDRLLEKPGTMVQEPKT